jgi:hypothetical protein
VYRWEIIIILVFSNFNLNDHFILSYKTQGINLHFYFCEDKLSWIQNQILYPRAKGGEFLDSLRLHNFKTSKGSEAFEITVNDYRGWPKHKKFKP